MNKQLISLLLAALILLTQQTCYAQDKLIILLDWFANPSHAPLFVAQQEGYFKEENLSVELIGPADPAIPPKLVAVDQADIAITYEPQFIEQIDRGLPLVRIATLIDKPLNCLVVLADSPIHSIRDLKGKRIGHSSSGMTNVALDTMLRHNGLSLNDVEAINVRYDLTQALLAQKIDGVTGMMRTFEVIQLDLAGHPARIFLPENNGVPNYSELILVVNKNKMNDPRFPRFLAALKKGVQHLKRHPESSWVKFSTLHPILNNELNHRAWKATLPYFANDPNYFNAKEWEKFIAFMRKNGLINQTKSLTEYAVYL